MNLVTLSGVLDGGFSPVSNDGVQFSVITKSTRNNVVADPDVFVVLAYGNAAQFLQQHAKSGNRLTLQGRISRENLGEGNWHTVITANHVLSISDSSQGMDFSNAIVFGKATSDGIRFTNSGKPVLSLNLENTRTYRSKDGNVSEYRTFIDATAWTNLAEDLAQKYSFPLTEAPVLVTGLLKPDNYTKDDGTQINKVVVWANEVEVFGAVEAAESVTLDAAGEDIPPARGSYRQAEAVDVPF